MALAIGTRLGAYEVLALLGSGGMGEVYRARDTKLNREVAVKVLPEVLAGDPAARARFEREAYAVAALSHPNILSIFEFGVEHGVPFAVTELLDGRTLREQLNEGVLPPRKAIEYALQIAAGVGAAHTGGVTHRDLKPENIFLTRDGRIKILDFGLARIADMATAGRTIQPTVRATSPGTVLGTVGYMAPEQVRGRELDHRSDIFSFGAILYEMLAGKRAFTGDSAVETMNAILKEDPPELTRTNAALPPALDRIVRRCLEKSPDERFQSARDVAFALEAISGASTSSGVAASLNLRVPGRVKRQAIWAAVGMLIGLVVGVTPQFVARLRPTAMMPAVRLSANLPAPDVLDLQQAEATIALSPDGQTLVYAVGQFPRVRLDRRSMTDGRITVIAGADGARNPFFSPDGKWVGFSRGPGFGASQLWKVPLAGGAPQALCDMFSVVEASWGDDGTIVFAPVLDSGLWRVSDAGGSCTPLTTLAKGEESHGWPDILPGSKAVIYTVEVSGQPFDNARIMIRPLPSGEPRLLVNGGYGARYSPSGHLLFGRANKLMAAPFDAEQLAVTGPAVPVIDDVSDEPSVGAARFALAKQGTLAYVAGGGRRAQRSLVWVDRSGAPVQVTDVGRAFQTPRLSPDGKQIAVRISAANEDLWLLDTGRSTLSRLTFEGENFSPIWTPDQQRIVFISNRTGSFNLFWKAADGTGTPEMLAAGPLLPGSASLSPDGKAIVFSRADPKTGLDLWMVHLDDDRTPRPIAQTVFSETSPSIAPDGRQIAYASNESGQFEIYVQPFPGPGAKRRVSVNSGVNPTWSRDGRELFFIQGDTLMSTRFIPGLAALNKPQPLFTGMSRFLANYDVAPDGKFLMVRLSDEETSTREISVIVNFLEELKARVPTK